MNTHISDISNLIQVRAFIHSMVDSISVKLSREEVKAIQQKVAQMDKAILTQSLGLDLSKLGEATKPAQVYTSTEDTKVVMEKLRSQSKKKPATDTAAKVEALSK